MKAPRLWIEARCAPETLVALGPEQGGYLGRVLRLKPGDAVRLFNGVDGEWLARIEAIDRRGSVLRLERRLRPQRASPDAWLLFAPVKRQATDWIVEKATELGVRELRPVITRRTNAETVRIERWEAIAREAAEQCERLDRPTIRLPEPLEVALQAWPPGRALYFADERPTAQTTQFAPRPFGVLIGPEGGLEETEREALAAHGAQGFTLGPRVLRAETAAVAALTLAMAAAGDWGISR